MAWETQSRNQAGGGECVRMKHRCLLVMFILVVVLFTGGCGLWLRTQQRQYACNRQLIAALLHGDTRQALTLIQEGADPNTPVTALPPPSFSRLLKQFLRHQSPSETGPTAFLLACGAECTTETPLDGLRRCRDDNPQLVEAMLAHNANINAQTSGNVSIVREAVIVNHYRIVEVLVQHGANINAQNTEGWTPLMHAAMYGSPRLVRLLLAHGADVHLRANDGSTALHCAVSWRRDKDSIGQLLAHGADPTQSDKFGQTPITLARDKHRPDIVALLKRAENNP